MLRSRRPRRGMRYTSIESAISCVLVAMRVFSRLSFHSVNAAPSYERVACQPSLGRGARRVRVTCAHLAGAGIAALALSSPAVTCAQNKPGVPGGILSDQFRFNAHPQMQFAASAPDPKFQHGAPDDRRRRADRGDPSGDACNLKCGK
ncbi:hypothetical protein DFQ28_006190 [Apophysomyces sp. BC1034]|nr:hypothetical protein DFQ28_006190 [Apophysomyces sp. BC1034]